MSSSESSKGAFRQVREYLGMTQLEAASVLGITQGGVSHIEHRGSGTISAVIKLIESQGMRAGIVIGRGRDAVTIPLSLVEKPFP